VHSDVEMDQRWALNRAGFGIVVVGGEDRKLVDVDDRFAAMHGYESVEMVGRSRYEFSAPSTWKPLGFAARASKPATLRVHSHPQRWHNICVYNRHEPALQRESEGFPLG
jgi:PAS domain-containing protein